MLPYLEWAPRRRGDIKCIFICISDNTGVSLTALVLVLELLYIYTGYIIVTEYSVFAPYLSFLSFAGRTPFQRALQMINKSSKVLTRNMTPLKVGYVLPTHCS